MLGEQIRLLRTARNLTQVQLARRLSVSKQSVSNWENNNIMPSVEQTQRLAELFGCTLDQLLSNERERRTIDVSGLKETQIAHIQQLVEDLRVGST